MSPRAARDPGLDLLARTEELCAIPSASGSEGALAAELERRLRAVGGGLAVERVDDNVIARTRTGRAERVVLAGHTDTVPPDGNERPRRDGDTLWGLGSADMKGGLAVMLALAEHVGAVAAGGNGAAEVGRGRRVDGGAADGLRFDVTFVFYVGEEVADEHNGLGRLYRERPELLDGRLAVLLEPTDCWMEAGCQGTMHVRATFRGARAHTARPWMGSNAVHRAVPALARIAAFEPETVTVDGLAYRESLQAVRVEAGVANNVVPDECTVVVNRRFAPSRTPDQVRDEVAALLVDADTIEVVGMSPAAAPNLWDPLVAEMVGTFDLAVRPKLGWTDVARFVAHGVPALNFGPGDPTLAHSAQEHVTRASLESCYAVLGRFLTESRAGA